MRSSALLNAFMGVALVTFASEAHAQQFKVGDRVDYNDFYGRYGGGWVPATVVLASPSTSEPGWVNYKIVVDVDPGKRDQSVLATELRPSRAAVAPAPAPKPAPVPVARPAPAPAPIARPAPAPAPNPARQPPGLSHCGGVQYQMQPYSKKRTYRTLDGRQAQGWMMGAGDASPIGSWKLNVGVNQSRVSSERRNNVVVDRYQITDAQRVGSITINPGGTFSYINEVGRRLAGRWTDLGDNIIELRGYANDVYTASVWQCRIQLMSPVNTRVWGTRL